MEENPGQPNFEDGQFSISPVYTLVQLNSQPKLQLNCHQAGSVSGNTDRAEVNLNNESAFKHKQKKSKSRKRKHFLIPSSDNESELKSDYSEEENKTTMTPAKLFRIVIKEGENK